MHIEHRRHLKDDHPYRGKEDIFGSICPHIVANKEHKSIIDAAHYVESRIQRQERVDPDIAMGVKGMPAFSDLPGFQTPQCHLVGQMHIISGICRLNNVYFSV